MPQLSFPCSVGELTAYLRGILESDALLSEVWVEGEISNLRTPSSGHVYFTLKDARAALRCVLLHVVDALAMPASSSSTVRGGADSSITSNANDSLV